jgi:hypothetical protein
MVMLPLFNDIERVQIDFSFVRSTSISNNVFSNSTKKKGGSMDYSLGSDDDSDEVLVPSTNHIFPPLDFESQKKIDEMNMMKEEVYC